MTAGKFWRALMAGLIIWGQRPGGPGGEPPAPSLDLKEALRLAFKANPNLQISRLQALVAGEQVSRAPVPGLLPSRDPGGASPLTTPEVRIPGGAQSHGWRRQFCPVQPELLGSSQT